MLAWQCKQHSRSWRRWHCIVYITLPHALLTCGPVVWTVAELFLHIQLRKEHLGKTMKCNQWRLILCDAGHVLQLLNMALICCKCGECPTSSRMFISSSAALRSFPASQVSSMPTDPAGIALSTDPAGKFFCKQQQQGCIPLCSVKLYPSCPAEPVRLIHTSLSNFSQGRRSTQRTCQAPFAFFCGAVSTAASTVLFLLSDITMTL